MFNCLRYINAIMHSSNKLHKTVKSIQHMFSQVCMRTQRTSFLSDSINLCTCMQTDTIGHKEREIKRGGHSLCAYYENKLGAILSTNFRII